MALIWIFNPFKGALVGKKFGLVVFICGDLATSKYIERLNAPTT